MSETSEMQKDEVEALISIYEGDQNFKQLNTTTFQYKYGEDDDNKSFLVEIQWVENYPNELPNINMDTFFNRNLIPEVKEKIKSVLIEEANQWIGCGMTYTLFECLKDRIDELVENQPDTQISNTAVDLSSNVETLKLTESDSLQKNTKKEQLTKSQKRRQWEKTDHKGERPRGWDWVDIIKHLSQTGHKEKHLGNVEEILSNPNA
ncbi:RWD domain-containing protein 4 [Condylostylus longicornis]|uniref:RWD domain-containing protein 4 n=1 Tax=Condylostylus longicornis TaxID=2530218 RepID=UPI00244DADC4|nr:RWD domain-containing protein 4 [Condylostylus longicornis]